MKKSRRPKPFKWSQAMERLFNRNIYVPVFSDAHTDDKHKLGIPDSIIAKDVLKNGMADFSVGWTWKPKGKKKVSISAEQRCQLYGFFPMKGHFFTSLANFKWAKAKIKRSLENDSKTILIDIGCGPATAGLALAELFPNDSFIYFGVDRSTAMCEMGKRLMSVARTSGISAKGTRTKWFESWDDIELPDGEIDVILNFSHFFASKKLSKSAIKQLAMFVESMMEAKNVSRLLLSYTNTDFQVGNTNYEYFYEQFKKFEVDSAPETRTIDYFKKIAGAVSNPVTFRREVFVLR